MVQPTARVHLEPGWLARQKGNEAFAHGARDERRFFPSKVKRCNKCQTLKDPSLFYKAKRGKGGFSSICKACDLVKAVKWNKANKEKVNASYRRYWASHPEHRKKHQARGRFRLSGCSPELYEKLFRQQGGACGICGVLQSNLKKALCADHCHKSRVVRGLLCFNCNRGLGLLKDNPKFLLLAAKWVGGKDGEQPRQ